MNCCSITKSCPAFCHPMNCSKPDFPVLHYLPEFAQTHVHWVSDSHIHLILCHPLLLLLSIFASIRVFSSELTLHIRWPKYWSFSFSISPSSDYSGLISLRIDCLISLLSKGLSRVFPSTSLKASILWCLPGGSEVKASAWNAGDLGSIPGSGRSPGEGNGNPLQYSCLENPMERGAW